ncbi:MAG: hypothetical protein ACRDZO_00950 [Egibacteraceae bacterium]
MKEAAQPSGGPLRRLAPLLDRLQEVTGRQVAMLLALFVVATILLLIVGPGRAAQDLAGPLLPLPNRAGTAIAEQLPRFLEALGPSGRGTYLTYLVLDLPYAGLFALTFSSAVAAATARYDKVPRDLRNLALVPLAAGACQFLTDLGILTLTLRSVDGPNALATLVGWLSASWLALTNITVILAAAALFGLAHHGMRAAEGKAEGK